MFEFDVILIKLAAVHYNLKKLNILLMESSIGVFIFFLLIYIPLCNLPAVAARKHGQSVFATFLVSLLLTPATGFLMVIANKEVFQPIMERDSIQPQQQEV
jgi:hypothetical protein